MIWMPTDDAYDMEARLARDEGLLIGHSAGANVAGAVRLARASLARGDRPVVCTVLPDRADRYFAARPNRPSRCDP